jgi:hypothetical protein
MKTAKSFIVATIVAGLCFALAPAVRAGGGPAGQTPCCQVVHPGADAERLKGTMAIIYDPGNDFNLDVILRLEMSQTTGFFRLNLNGPGANISGKTDEEIACLIINPFESTEFSPIRGLVHTFVANILGTFFPGHTPEDTRLVIKASSISNMQGYLECEASPPEPPGNVLLCAIPGTQRVSSIGDIVIYAITQKRFQKINSACE